MKVKLLDRVESIVTQGEIAHYQQFFLVAIMFSKSHLLQRCQKASVCGKGLTELKKLLVKEKQSVLCNFSIFITICSNGLLQRYQMCCVLEKNID